LKKLPKASDGMNISANFKLVTFYLILHSLFCRCATCSPYSLL